MTTIIDNIYSSNSEDWYSPKEYTIAARKVLGQIDLDPASCEIANRFVLAKKFYTKEQDGLSMPWFGHMWLNPPYGRIGKSRQKGKTEIWVQHLIEEYCSGNVTEAILLVNAYLYKQWFQALWEYYICFPCSRLAFWNEKGKYGRSPHSSALVYFGNNTQKFIEVYSQFGRIVKAIESPIMLHEQLQMF